MPFPSYKAFRVKSKPSVWSQMKKNKKKPYFDSCAIPLPSLPKFQNKQKKVKKILKIKSDQLSQRVIEL